MAGSHKSTPPGVRLGDIDTGNVSQLRSDGGDRKYADGYLLFVLGGELMAQRFDLRSLTVTGEPASVADINPYNGETGTNFSIGAGGIIAFARSRADAYGLDWSTRTGERVVADAAGDWRDPELSPDATFVVATLRESDAAQEPRFDLWLYGVQRRTSRMLVSGRPDDVYPAIWSADGRRVRFFREGNGLQEIPADGGAEQPIGPAQDAETALRGLSLASRPMAVW